MDTVQDVFNSFDATDMFSQDTIEPTYQESAGFLNLGDNGVCTPEIQQCKNCDSTGTNCLECEVGYYRLVDYSDMTAKSCLTCTDFDSACLECDGYQCTKCFDGYFPYGEGCRYDDSDDDDAIIA